MNRFAIVLLFLGSGCVRHATTSSAAPPLAHSVEAPVPVPIVAAVPAGGVQERAAAAPTAPAEPEVAPAQEHASSAAEAPAAEEAKEEDDEASSPSDAESESHDAAPAESGAAIRYTGELSDEELAKRWKDVPLELGSISIGFVDEGRLVNAEQFPAGDGWVVVSPERAWATKETIDYVISAIHQVKAEHPEAPPLRVNQISAREGGYIPPHKSHQSGRDVDLGFYYATAETIWARERERYIDVARNWALLKALVTSTDVQLILVDTHVQKVIYDYALKSGEDKAWLDSLFHAGASALIQHARRHRDHFHVRFYSPRAQELGRRLAPLLAQRPEQNLVMHRVRSGDTLGAIAHKYGSSVAALQKVNHLKGSFLRLAQVLKVPLRGPCTQCPMTPAIVVPARRLPPSAQAQRKAEPPAEAQPRSTATGPL